jgi:hypothetical protein
MGAMTATWIVLFALSAENPETASPVPDDLEDEPAGPVIQVLAGSYGENCGRKHGNVTGYLAESCDGRRRCAYRIDSKSIGDPAIGCGKEYVAEWRCSGSARSYRAYARPEAGFGTVLTLACPPLAEEEPPARPRAVPHPRRPATEPPLLSPALPIHVVAGSYGGNCHTPHGNVTAHLAEKCDGRTQCPYRIHTFLLGDPAHGCGKSYLAEWKCGDELWIRSDAAEPEAGHGSVVFLTCDRKAGRKRLPPEGPLAAHGPIHVHSAKFGRSCGKANDEATKRLAMACNGRWLCEHPVPPRATIRDAEKCRDDYVATWTCGDDPDLQHVRIPLKAEACATTVLHCP